MIPYQQNDIVEINDYPLVYADNGDFVLPNLDKIKILGSTNGRNEGILFVHMGEIVVGKKIEIERYNRYTGLYKRFLLTVDTLRVNGVQRKTYSFK